MRSSIIIATIGCASAFVQPNHFAQKNLKASSTQAGMVESTSLVESAAHVAQHLTAVAEMAERTFQPQMIELINGIECDNAMTWYSDNLRDHPLPTKAATAGVIAAIGDAIAQRRDASPLDTDDEFQYDIMKGASMITFSVLYAGIFQHFWFDWLNNNLEATLVSNASLGPNILAAAKLFINQVLIVPTVYMPLFFGVTGALAGMTVSDTFTKARSQFVPLLKQKYTFWLPAQFVQFAFVAPEWQITYLCSAGLVWTVILSSFGTSLMSAEK